MEDYSERRQRFSFFRTSKLATPILFLTLELVKPQPTNLRIVQNYKQRKTILKKMELRARLTFDSSNNWKIGTIVTTPYYSWTRGCYQDKKWPPGVDYHQMEKHRVHERLEGLELEMNKLGHLFKIQRGHHMARPSWICSSAGKLSDQGQRGIPTKALEQIVLNHLLLQ